MSGSDVELLREGFELHNRGDADGMLALAADDVDIFIQEDLPNGGHWDGVDGFRDVMASWNEAWDEFTAEPVRFEEGPHGWFVRVKQHARAGELVLEADFFYVFAVTEGRISRWHLYNDEARAREVAGLGG